MAIGRFFAPGEIIAGLGPVLGFGGRVGGEFWFVDLIFEIAERIYGGSTGPSNAAMVRSSNDEKSRAGGSRRVGWSTLPGVFRWPGGLPVGVGAAAGADFADGAEPVAGLGRVGEGLGGGAGCKPNSFSQCSVSPRFTRPADFSGGSAAARWARLAAARVIKPERKFSHD